MAIAVGAAITATALLILKPSLDEPKIAARTRAATDAPAERSCIRLLGDRKMLQACSTMSIISNPLLAGKHFIAGGVLTGFLLRRLPEKKIPKSAGFAFAFEER